MNFSDEVKPIIYIYWTFRSLMEADMMANSKVHVLHQTHLGFLGRLKLETPHLPRLW